MTTFGDNLPSDGTCRYVANLQLDQVTAPELAIDREVEENEVSLIAFKPNPGPDRPDLLYF
ncbi:MAG: hypothetical protein KKC43_13375 [Alphaproteobacteria bacterium]|nr:hypothetical protein [Alphaproteobacteria bacterium]